MPGPSRPFVRVYHDDLMRDYPEVYDDDAALATWLRLLVIADRMWPTPPELPLSARGRGMRLLLKVGLVEKVSARLYSIRGYARERAMRQQSARNAAALRWHSEGNAVGISSTKPNTNPKENALNAHEKRTGKLERVDVILPRILP